jgi:ribosomal protein L7/L12
MNSSSASIEMADLIASLRDSISSGGSREELIRTMKLSGLNQIACIKLLRELSGISLADAKEAVHYSEAWSDHRQSNDALHSAALQAAKELGVIEISN